MSLLNKLQEEGLLVTLETARTAFSGDTDHVDQTCGQTFGNFFPAARLKRSSFG